MDDVFEVFLESSCACVHSMDSCVWCTVMFLTKQSSWALIYTTSPRVWHWHMTRIGKVGMAERGKLGQKMHKTVMFDSSNLLC